MRTAIFCLTIVLALGCAAPAKEEHLSGDVRPEDVTSLTPAQARDLVNRSEWRLILDLQRLRAISEDVAKELAKFDHGVLRLGLDGALTPAVAKALGGAQAEHIVLDGLTNVAPDVAEHLAATQGTLSLRGVEHLSLASAKALSRHQSTLYLNGLANIEDATLAELRKHKGDVHLEKFRNSVRVLKDPELARFLAKGYFSGHFNSLEELSVEVADVLGSEAGWLSLPNLRNISAELARSLIKTEHLLELDGLQEIDVVVARCLAESRDSGPDLFLRGLKSIDADVAAALANQKGALFLDGINSLTPQAASQLARHSGGPLYLQGLRTVTPDVAAALSQSKSWIYLGVTDLSLSTARLLADGENLRGLTLTAMSELAPDVAATLVSNQKLMLELPKVTAEVLTPQLSAVFAKSKCILLKLSGITQVTPQLARDIAFYDCRLELTNVSELSVESARLLSANRGLLDFPAVPFLTKEVAEEFAAHRGVLKFHWARPQVHGLTGLREHKGTLVLCVPDDPRRGGLRDTGMHVDEAVAKALSEHQGPLILTGLRTLASQPALELAKRTAVTYLEDLEMVETQDALEALQRNQNIILSDGARFFNRPIE